MVVVCSDLYRGVVFNNSSGAGINVNGPSNTRMISNIYRIVLHVQKTPENIADVVRFLFIIDRSLQRKFVHTGLITFFVLLSSFVLVTTAAGEGGANCTFCHDINGTAQGKLVNFTAMNSSDAIHTNLNRNATSPSGYPSANFKCWACHGDGSEPPSNEHPANFGTPYICTYCHINLHESPVYLPCSGICHVVEFGTDIPIATIIKHVDEHYWNGSSIKTIAVASCMDCHNKSEMMLGPNPDPDGSGTIYGGANGGNNSTSHYGRKRGDLRSWDSGSSENCSYCHQNASTAFNTAMVDPDNASKANHSTNYNSTNPGCTSPACHNTGLFHDSTLNKPVSSDTLCKTCHGTGGSASRNNRSEHKNLYCTICHANSTDRALAGKDIHPIKYLLRNNTFETSNASAVDCTTCHQFASVDSSLGAFTPPKIMNPLNHSSNISNGSLWGSYWTNTSPLTACIYCHDDTKHNSTPLGRILTWSPDYSMYGRIATNSSCADCHYKNSINYIRMSSTFTAAGLPIPPEITNGTNWNGTFLNYYNHSLGTYFDSDCRNCHGSLLSAGANMSEFVHNVGVGAGGTDCALCHDVNGIAPKKINFSDFRESVHASLNSLAVNNTLLLNTVDKACWACHGDGNEPVGGHPSNYKTPKNCNNNDCHSLAQSSYFEPMVYSHFQNASLNDNPNNVTNYNLTTTEQCQNCHINSIVKDDSNSKLSIVSHYASKRDLIDSFNCVYCHLDKDNSEDWGNTTLINKDRVGTIEVNREDNNITLFQGQTIYLGEGYSLKLIEISGLRGDAFIQILNEGVIVDQAMVGQDNPYTYEREITVDNATFKTPAVTIRIKSIFTGPKDNFIIFEAFRPRKVHTEKENKNSACFACHLYRYSNEKVRYKIIDREAKEDGRDIIYYTRVLLDHKLENMSKIYSDDEDYVFDQFGIMGKFISVPHFQEYLEDGQIWNIADNYSLKFKASSTGRQAWLEFRINHNTVEEDVVSAGSVFTYEPGIRYKEYTDTNVTIFTTNVSAVFLGQKDFIILIDSELLSTQILKTTANTTQFGYNSSWLHPGDRFTLGKIPTSLHTPNLFDNPRDWVDCVRCHDSSKNLRISQINAISSQLGKHSTLNAAAPDSPYMSNSIDKACLACHTDGTEPNTHSPTYVEARNCTSCHTYQDQPTYDAKNISDEPHGYFSACELCHMPRPHEIIKPEMIPSIIEADLSRIFINKGDSLNLTAKASGGIGMKIRSAEYFIDTTGDPGYGIPLRPVDGVFDSQVELVVAEINTSNISIGTHVIYIHAMERDNKWGEFYPINFTLISGAPGAGQIRKNAAALDLGSMVIALLVLYFIISKFGKR